MKEAGFVNIKLKLPTKETSFPDLFKKCLKFESEEDFDNPKTLIVEGEKIC